MISKIISRIEAALVWIPAAVALGLVIEQAGARYFYPHALYDWADEITVYLIMWSVLFSLGRVSADGAHIRAEVLVDRLSPQKQRIIEIGICILAVLFMGLLGWLGWRVMAEAFTYDDRTSSSLRFPIWIYYAVLPAASLSMGLGFLLRLIGLIKSTNVEGLKR